MAMLALCFGRRVQAKALFQLLQSANWSRTILACAALAAIRGAAKCRRSFTRKTVSWNIVRVSVSAKNCLGLPVSMMAKAAYRRRPIRVQEL